LKEFPAWNLPLVLTSLTRHPYEPLAKADLRWLSYKTLFLVMLASAKRRGEIHALDYRRISWKHDRSEVVLFPVPGFLPKVLATAELQVPAYPNSSLV
jgi:hypothetical protein